MQYPVGNKGEIALEGKAHRPIIAFIKCYTGFVGSESTDVVFFDTGYNIDETARELAVENAQSHGYEGSYECPDCGNTSEEDAHCSDCGQEMDWEENDGVQGCAYLFALSYHPARIGGFSWSEIIRLLIDAGAAIAWCAPGSATEYHVKRDMLFGENGLFNDLGNPQKEWDFFVEDAGFDGINIVEYVASV